MQLVLQRLEFTDSATFGELTVEGYPLTLVTLELPNRDGKPGSCIPQGTYPVVLGPSPKFEHIDEMWVRQYATQMPHIIQIPDRSLIMIHWGNEVAETDGCVLVGVYREGQDIASSRMAFDNLWKAASEAMRANQCTIEVLGGAKFLPPADLSPQSNV